MNWNDAVKLFLLHTTGFQPSVQGYYHVLAEELDTESLKNEVWCIYLYFGHPPG